MAPARSERHFWIEALALVGIVLVGALLYWPSTRSLLEEWFLVPSSAYRHGPLIALISVALAIRAVRHEMAEITPEAAPWLPMALLLVVSLVWLITLRAGIQVAHQALLPIVIWLSVWILLGWRIALLTAVPLALLYSGIPAWHVGVPVLQSLTVSLVGGMLRVAGISAHVEGDFVHIRSGVFHVEDGCAGLHYFIVAVTLAIIYGELRNDRWRVRFYLVALAAALALVSNWLRVFIIIVAGDLSDMQHYLVRADHEKFGWVVFAVAMVVFLLIARWWLSTAEHSAGTTVAVAKPASRRGAARNILLGLLISAIGPAWLVLAPVRAATGPNVSMPAAVEGWDGPSEPCHGGWRPQYVGADLRQQREFSSAGGRVCVYLATYLSQHQDKEMVGYFSSAYAPDSQVVATTVREAAGHEVNEVQLSGERVADRLVWYGYVVGERELRRGIAAQLSYAMGSLHGAPAASVYALSASCVPDCAAARELLTGFLPHVRVR